MSWDVRMDANAIHILQLGIWCRKSMVSLGNVRAVDAPPTVVWQYRGWLEKASLIAWDVLTRHKLQVNVDVEVVVAVGAVVGVEGFNIKWLA